MSDVRWSLFALFLSASVVPAQQKAGKEAANIEARVEFKAKASLRMIWTDEKIELVTPQGKIAIPAADIRGIHFGDGHLSEALEQRIKTAVKGLISKQPRERELAEAELEPLRIFALPHLFEASKSKDPQLAQAARKLLGDASEEDVRARVEDRIVTRTETVSGKLVGPTLSFERRYFGSVKVPLHELAEFTVVTPEDPGKALKFHELAPLLDEVIDMKVFQNPMTLKEFIELVIDQFANRGKDLPVHLDQQAFCEEDPNMGQNVYQTKIWFQPFPKKMTLAAMLRSAVGRIEGKVEGKSIATYLIRNGAIEITTLAHASPEALLDFPVIGHFDKRPLEEAISALADRSGATILFDPRLSDKKKTPVSAVLRGVPVEAAVRRLAESAGLQAHLADNILVIGEKSPETERKKAELRLRDRRLDLAVKELAAWSGDTVLLDPRYRGLKVTGPDVTPRDVTVSAVFKPAVSSAAAARVLANQAGLSVVVLDNLVYITDTATAARMTDEKAGKFPKENEPKEK